MLLNKSSVETKGQLITTIFPVSLSSAADRSSSRVYGVKHRKGSAIANMAAHASPIVPRASAWVSGLNFQRWSEILKRVVCDVVCMQIRLSGNRVARVGEERGEQFPSGASRNFGNRGCRARMCARTCTLGHTCECT